MEMLSMVALASVLIWKIIDIIKMQTTTETHGSPLSGIWTNIVAFALGLLVTFGYGLGAGEELIPGAVPYWWADRIFTAAVMAAGPAVIADWLGARRNESILLPVEMLETDE